MNSACWLRLHQDESGRWSGHSLFPWAELTGINIGSAGIHLALQSLPLSKNLKEFHEKGLNRIQQSEMSSHAFGLFTGNTGVAHCLAECVLLLEGLEWAQSPGICSALSSF